MNSSQYPTPSTTFCDGLGFGRLQDSRHYAYCLRVNAVDRKEQIVKIQDNFPA